MKSIALIFALAVSIFGMVGDNYTGYGDTANIHGFRSDSLKYTPWFKLSAFQDVRIDIMANDTSSAGFASDSIKFIWGFQTARPTLNSTNARDTAISKVRLVCDTLDRVGGTFADSLVQIDGTGAYTIPLKMVDSVSVSGFLSQSRNFSPEWDVMVRGWVKGLTGNKTASYIKTRMAFYRRVKTPAGE